MDNNRYIGLMSGTSLDAVDAVLVDFTLAKPKILASHSLAIPAALKTTLMELSLPGYNKPDQDKVEQLGSADVAMGELFATAVQELLSRSGYKPDDVIAIGSHGQTLRHRPEQMPCFTLQIGDPNTIAQLTGITTVADFRRRDMANGGQGAPFAPAFHYEFFYSANEDRVIANIGGIANISVLPANKSLPIIGFDTGPGNTLLDLLSNKHLDKPYDENGQWAAQGEIDKELLSLLLSDPYFAKPYPKSTGKELFNASWLDKQLQAFGSDLPATDIQATLTALTACSIAQAVVDLKPNKLVVCGGGAYNKFLIDLLRTQISEVILSHEIGLAPEWVEACGFAWLAKQRLENKPIDLRMITGSKTPSLLGGIY